jgi:tetratricopeptide (TPR) repeat protein
MVEKLAKKEVIPAQMLDISVDEQRVLAVLGYDAITKKNYERAEKIFRGLIALNPQSNLGYTGMGKLRAAQGKTEEALKAFHRRSEGVPQRPRSAGGSRRDPHEEGPEEGRASRSSSKQPISMASIPSPPAPGREILTQDFTKQELADYVKSGEVRSPRSNKQIEAIKAGTPVLQATGGTRPSAAKPAAAPVAPPRPMRA